jgi:hypothetical protein
MLIIYKKLTPEEAEENIRLTTLWFQAHPERRVCRTDLFKVRRSHIREDIEAHAALKGAAGQSTAVPVISAAEFRRDVDNRAWYIQALETKKIGYWNFNSFLWRDMRPCFATLDVPEAKGFFGENYLVTDKYKGFVLWTKKGGENGNETGKAKSD